MPFNATSKKAYIATTGMGRVYSLAFDSTTAVGADTLYHHFAMLNDTSINIDPNCIGWGTPYCLPLDIPEWSGSFFCDVGNGNYLLRNGAGDTLHFDLALGLNDTSTFFEHENERFAITLESLDTLTVIGVLDSMRTYRILHTDTVGTPILSGLHQQPLRIGKVLGLTHFFQIDSFPQVLKPLMMIGNKSPDAGLHQITNELIYDHQPGDEIQWHHEAYYNPGEIDRYRKVSFLTRTDTPDSIEYDVVIEDFDVLDGTSLSQNYIWRYYRYEVMAEIPFERFFNAYYHSFGRYDHCGMPLWSYGTSKALYLFYCPEGKCYSFGDTQGPDTSDDDAYVLGLGHYGSSMSNSGPPPWGFFDHKQVNYFKKDSVDCGNEQFVGVAEHAAAPAISIFPNPTTGLLALHTSGSVERLDVFDATGSVAMSDVPMRSNSVDLGLLGPGVYLLKMRFANGTIAHRTVVCIN